MRSKVMRGQLVFCKNEFTRYCNCPSSVNFVDSFPPRGSQEIRRKNIAFPPRGSQEIRQKNIAFPLRGKAFLMQSFRGSEIVSNVNVTVRYETGDACKAVGKFQACKQQSVTKQAKPARQSANFKRASNNPLRNRRSLQGSRRISSVQATIRYETGEACCPKYAA